MFKSKEEKERKIKATSYHFECETDGGSKGNQSRSKGKKVKNHQMYPTNETNRDLSENLSSAITLIKPNVLPKTRHLTNQSGPLAIWKHTDYEAP